MNEIVTSHITTPLGPMIVGVFDNHVCILEFTNRRGFDAEVTSLQKMLNVPMVQKKHLLHSRVEQQITEYFEGTLKEFDFPVLITGTDFENAVWKVLDEIPYGETRTYLQIAEEIENPRAVRAVGRAIGKNKICIAIPCHRVIGSNGSLTGYASGLPRKQWFLEHEKK